MTAKEALMAALCTAKARNSNETLPENTVAAREGAIVGDNAIVMDSVRLVRGRTSMAMDAKGTTMGPDGIEVKNVGRGGADGKNAAAAKIEQSIADHDQRFHKNGFDPKKNKCKFREKMAAQAEAMGIAGQVDNLGWVDDGEGGETLLVHGDDRTETANSQEFKGYQDQLAAINEKYKEFGGKLNDNRVDKMTPEEKAAWEKKKGEVDALRSAYLDTALGQAEAASVKHLQNLAKAGGDIGAQAVEVAKGILADEGSSDAQKEGAKAILEAAGEGEPSSPISTEGGEEETPAEEPEEKTVEETAETEETVNPEMTAEPATAETETEETVAEEAEPEESGEEGTSGEEEDVSDDFDPEVTAELARRGYNKDGTPMTEEQKRKWQEKQGREAAAEQQRRTDAAIATEVEKGAESVNAKKQQIDQIQSIIDGLIKHNWDPEQAKRGVLANKNLTPEQFDEMKTVIDGAAKALYDASPEGRAIKAAEEAIGKGDEVRKMELEGLKNRLSKTKDMAQKAAIIRKIDRLTEAANNDRSSNGGKGKIDYIEDGDPNHAKGGITRAPRGAHQTVDVSGIPDLGKAAQQTEDVPGKVDKLNESLQNIKHSNQYFGDGRFDSSSITVDSSETSLSIPLTKVPSRSKLNEIAEEFRRNLGDERVSVRTNGPKNKLIVSMPNKVKGVASFHGIMNSPEWQAAKKDKKRLMLMGVDEHGKMLTSELNNKMPHMYVVGATGSGKTQGMMQIANSLIIGSTPADNQVSIIDPKRGSDWSVYKDDKTGCVSGVFTESSEAVNHLKWMVNEMENRLRFLGGEGDAKDIDAYNDKVGDSVDENGNPLKIPHRTVIIDELADLMKTDRKEVLPLLERLAAVGRAAGIHLILGTQNPNATDKPGSPAPMPTSLRNNIQGKFMFKATDQNAGRLASGETLPLHELPGEGAFFWNDGSKTVRGQGTFMGEEAEVTKHVMSGGKLSTESGHEVGDEIKFKPRGGGEQKTARVGSDGKWHEVNADGSDGREVKFKSVPRKKATPAPAPAPAPTSAPADTETSGTGATATSGETAASGSGSAETASPAPAPAPAEQEAPAAPKNHITKSYREWSRTPEAVAELASMQPGDYRTFEGAPGYYLQKQRNGKVEWMKMPDMPELPEEQGTAATPSAAPTASPASPASGGRNAPTNSMTDEQRLATVDVKGKSRSGTAGAKEGQTRGSKASQTPMSHSAFVKAQKTLQEMGDGWKIDGGDNPMLNGNGEVYARNPANGSYGVIDKDGNFHYRLNTTHPAYKGKNSPEAKAAERKLLGQNFNEAQNQHEYNQIAYGIDEMPLEMLKEWFEGR